MFWPFFIFGNTLNNDSYIVLLSHYFNVFYIVYIVVFTIYTRTFICNLQLQSTMSLFVWFKYHFIVPL